MYDSDDPDQRLSESEAEDDEITLSNIVTSPRRKPTSVANTRIKASQATVRNTTSQTGFTQTGTPPRSVLGTGDISSDTRQTTDTRQTPDIRQTSTTPALPVKASTPAPQRSVPTGESMPPPAVTSSKRGPARSREVLAPTTAVSAVSRPPLPDSETPLPRQDSDSDGEDIWLRTISEKLQHATGRHEVVATKISDCTQHLEDIAKIRSRIQDNIRRAEAAEPNFISANEIRRQLEEDDVYIRKQRHLRENLERYCRDLDALDDQIARYRRQTLSSTPRVPQPTLPAPPPPTVPESDPQDGYDLENNVVPSHTSTPTAPRKPRRNPPESESDPNPPRKTRRPPDNPPSGDDSGTDSASSRSSRRSKEDRDKDRLPKPRLLDLNQTVTAISAGLVNRVVAQQQPLLPELVLPGTIAAQRPTISFLGKDFKHLLQDIKPKELTKAQANTPDVLIWLQTLDEYILSATNPTKVQDSKMYKLRLTLTKGLCNSHYHAAIDGYASQPNGSWDSFLLSFYNLYGDRHYYDHCHQWLSSPYQDKMDAASYVQYAIKCMNVTGFDTKNPANSWFVKRFIRGLHTSVFDNMRTPTDHVDWDTAVVDIYHAVEVIKTKNANKEAQAAMARAGNPLDGHRHHSEHTATVSSTNKRDNRRDRRDRGRPNRDTPSASTESPTPSSQPSQPRQKKDRQPKAPSNEPEVKPDGTPYGYLTFVAGVMTPDIRAYRTEKGLCRRCGGNHPDCDTRPPKCTQKYVHYFDSNEEFDEWKKNPKPSVKKP